ncbi:hypothetical protein QFZ37_000557 [Chryseobacterium ginsenosidimutans]|uniref:hypothetical protein n=1 Tax=Chryseobacterium ginsenosidimutans TaxID=687846 RepID=UPI0027864FCF|nr:hypothetical protein [Chryseobacterium ginsenosidimutans]MDQ0592188.1 hypothetical protein [Chryseobacterium ginsenosidimutans]
MKKINITKIREEIIELQINYFFTSSSFEERCFTISNELANLDFKTKIFYNENELESIIENSIILENLFKSKVERIGLNTDNSVINYLNMLNVIKDITEEKTANLLIDITTFTHETLLILIKLLNFYKKDLGKIYICYNGAKEYSVNEKNEDDKWLSKGIKEIRTVIGYPGFSDPTRNNHLLILFGFESDRTKRLINEFEFDNVTLGFADEENSIQANHQYINAKRHEKLVSEFKTNTFKFSLIDIDSVKDNILQLIRSEKYKEMNTVIAPMNNKISTIAAALAAIEDENLQITYAKPSIYNVSGYSTPNDDIYLCELNLQGNTNYN